MLLSAEVRLWWQNGYGAGVEQWFEGLGSIPPGGLASDQAGPARRDLYVRDTGTELGIKLRAADGSDPPLEIKSLVAIRAEAMPFGPVTIWTKTRAPSPLADGVPTIAILKRRRLRKYAWSDGSLTEIPLDARENVRGDRQPAAGCNIEITRVCTGRKDGAWLTLGYEAFGELDEVERVLHACLLKSKGRAAPPATDEARPGSYPEWLVFSGI